MMKKLSQTTQSRIKSTIQQSVKPYATQGKQTFLTDIHFMLDPQTGELTLYDDDDHMLGSALVSEWAGLPSEGIWPEVERGLSSILSGMKARGELDGLDIIKPYSFVLVDEDHETLSELLLVDDDTLLLSESLLHDLDTDLDNFLHDLMEDGQ